MSIMKSTDNKTSRYVSGGTTENEELGIGWWERKDITQLELDKVVQVTGRHVNRIDLIAYDFLGDSKLWWVIAMYNIILDPHSEIYEGKYIRIPSTSAVQLLLSGKPGGVNSQREVKPSITPII